jgi:hypothetical protein
LKAPVPVEEIADKLDIEEIHDVTTDGFEGGLITDAGRSRGVILVNRAARRGRRRFTVGHELGHFLMTHHKPPPEGFRCSREDMRRLSAKEQDAYGKMEVEANAFSGLLIMPPPLLRTFVGRYREGDLSHVMEVAEHFDVSKEMAARGYAQFHDQRLAVLVAKDGKMLRTYRHPQFPRLCVQPGQPIPKGTLFHRDGHKLHQTSVVAEARAEVWLDTDWDNRLLDLSEQVYVQQDGYALVMLWAEGGAGDDDDEDPDENRTSKQRLQDRQTHRWG